MKAFARFIVKRNVAWMIIVVVLGASALSAFYANKVVQDDDLLAFLPTKNPQVEGFRQVADRFGSLDIALVGIESDDVFEKDFLDRLKALTKELEENKAEDGLEFTLSLTTVQDFTADKERGGITTDYLVRDVLPGDEARERLRALVLSRDHIVGNLVSADGRAVMLYCFASPGAQPRAVAKKIQERVDKYFPDEHKYWGGAPFVSTYIYDVTQRDLSRLAPWACLAIAVIVLLSFKDLVGTGLSLLSTMLGIVVPLGIMGFSGFHTNIVLGSMPVILFALGSAYGVHLLTRFYALSAEGIEREDALRGALEDVGPSILGSGLTTVFGLLSFIMMDIAPMRTFGIFTALGLTISLVVALTFIPAVLVISPFRGRNRPTLVWVNEWMARLCVWVQRHKVPVGIVSVLLTAGSAFYALRVDSRMDTAAFFDKGSPPDRADEFARRHFGGSQFIQIQVKADLTDPAVLRELQLLGDRIAVLDGVSGVTHIAGIVAQVNEALIGTRRLPDTAAQVRQLYPFLIGQNAVSQTVTDDYAYGMILVKVTPTDAAAVERVLAEVERLTKETLPASLTLTTTESSEANTASVRRHRAELVSARIGALAVQLGTRVTKPDDLRAALELGTAPPDLPAIEAAVVGFIKSEAFGVPLPKDPDGTKPGEDTPSKLAHAVVALGAPPTEPDARKAWRANVPSTVAGVLPKDTDPNTIDDAALAFEQNVEDYWVQQRAKDRARQVIEASGVAVPEGEKGERFRTFLGHALIDLEVASVLTAAPGPEADQRSFETLVTGLPVLYRGLSVSVFNNQWNSLWFALVLVIGLKALLFRSFWTGILSSIPTLLTLLLIYGGMGLMGVHLDIGTSMLASLIIGAGDDYAVQFLWSWSVPATQSLERAARAAAQENGAGIWTNAVMVGAGFFVLTLGEARPLQNVGGLTAAAMIAAAITTFVICPLLARKRHYAPIPAPSEESAGPASEPVQVESR